MARKPKTPPEPLAIDSDFTAALEQGIRRILSDSTATPHQLAAAVSAGIKIQSFRHKSKEGDDDNASFYR